MTKPPLPTTAKTKTALALMAALAFLNAATVPQMLNKPDEFQYYLAGQVMIGTQPVYMIPVFLACCAKQFGVGFEKGWNEKANP